MRNNNFRYIDDCAFIRLVDSFVKVNKFGTGNGEAALYLGNKRDSEIFLFFGTENFDVHCLMLKEDLLQYLDDVKMEYLNNRYVYRNPVNLETWNRFHLEVQGLPDELHFDLTRKRQFDKTGRVYAQELTYKRSNVLSLECNHKAFVYDLIRRISIPEVSYIMLTRLDNNVENDFNAKLYYDPNF